MSNNENGFYMKAFQDGWPANNGGGGVLPYPKALYYNSKFFEKVLSLKAMHIYLGLLVCTNHKKPFPKCWHTQVQIETLSKYTPGKVSKYFTILRTKKIVCPICEKVIANQMVKAKSNGRGWYCDLTPGINAARHLQEERAKNPRKFDKKMAAYLAEKTTDKHRQAARQNIIGYHIEQGHRLQEDRQSEPIPRFTPRKQS